MTILSGALNCAAETRTEWPTFRQADADGSGALSIDEVQTVPVLADDFAVHDKNSDGKLSRAEFEAAKRAAGTTNEAAKATGTGTGSNR